MTTKRKKNREPVPKVTEIPGACQRCGSTERTGKERAVKEPLHYCSTLPNGQRYNFVQNFRAICKHCGQRLAYNQYGFDPKLEESAA